MMSFSRIQNLSGNRTADDGGLLEIETDDQSRVTLCPVSTLGIDLGKARVSGDHGTYGLDDVQRQERQPEVFSDLLGHGHTTVRRF